MPTYARGTLVIGAVTQTLIVKKETVSVQAGLIHKNLPANASAQAWQAAIWGRGREITVEGRFNGTQADIEAFLDTVESWVNAGGFQTTAQYYPLHHKDNTAAGSSQQSGYWNVMSDQFTYDYDEEIPTMLNYTLVLREGTKLGVFSVIAGGT